MTMASSSASTRWQDLTTRDFATSDPETWIAVLPLAAIEQHGAHLPLATDALINAGILERALARTASGTRPVVLPMLSIGDSIEHQAFAGTLTLEPETLVTVIQDIGRSVARAGVRKLMLFNSHGGQPPAMDIAALKLRRDESLLVGKASYFRFGLPDGLFEVDELAHGIHGGAVETSVMLHLHPEAVRTEALPGAEAFRQSLGCRLAGEGKALGPTADAADFAWMTQDLHPSGVVGNAQAADAEKGRLIVEHAADRLAAVLDEFQNLPLETLTDGHD